MQSGIYRIVNKNNNKCYVGQTKNLGPRHRQHWGELRLGHHSNQYLQDDWNKDSAYFKFEILEKCPLEQLNERERYWIQFYDSTNREKGYNIQLGGAHAIRKKSTAKYINRTKYKKK